MAFASPAPRIASRATPDAPSSQNVADPERVGSVILGAALVTFGLRRRDTGGILAALLGGAFIHRGATGHCHVYDALGVSTGSADAVLDRPHGITGRSATVNARRAIKVERNITIDVPRATLYAFWRDFQNLPRFMSHLVSVTPTGSGRSRWVAKAPAGQTVEWDAELVNDVPNAIIAWKSVGMPDVANAGAVNFSDAPSGRGTVVKVSLDYEPPGGKVGALVARLLGEDPDRQVREDLHRLKELMEQGGAGTLSGRPTSATQPGSVAAAP